MGCSGSTASAEIKEVHLTQNTGVDVRLVEAAHEALQKEHARLKEDFELLKNDQVNDDQHSRFGCGATHAFLARLTRGAISSRR